MTAFISEFRSMTFQCKSEISSSIQFSELNSYIGRDHTMAPQQQLALPKSSDRVIDSEQSRENQVSPVSSLGGTSMESSSPALPNEVMPQNLSRNYETERSQIADPSSDDSGSIPNDLSGYQDELPSPLEQLQCALGKDGMLGQKLHLSDYPGEKDDIRNSSNASLSSAEQSCIYYDSSDLYKCHLCAYASSSKQEFNIHMNSHFDHKCPYCDYTSRTEGRLKRHVKDFHSETPPESWAGTRVPRADLSGAEQSMDDSVTSSNGKSRTYRCKQCDFVAYQKNDFWEHNKTHIKAEKLLLCPQCPFVTEYKHHLEYHIRNHFGSKPFKCTKCNYSCVNKSMLNSHMKSHSNIYQYRCANCTYATKYCHSLKLHLRKYEHKPATVLNLDGTPNPYPVIDVYGTRRGPRSKKRRCLEDSENNSVSSTAVVPSHASMNYAPNMPLLPPNVPVMYPTQFFNGYPNSVYMKPHQPADNSNYPMGMSHIRVKQDSPLKCVMCEFVTDHKDLYQKHLILHAAAENQDLVKLYGINSDSLLHFQDQMMFNNYLQSRRHYMEHLPRTERNAFESYDIQERLANEYELKAKTMKDEDENSVIYQRNVKTSSPRNDIRKELSSPSRKEQLSPLCANTSDSLCEIERQDKDSNEDNERSVIVAHKTSPSSGMEHMETEMSDTCVKNVDHSPLDLSGPKPVDPVSTINKSKTSEENPEKQILEPKNVSPNGSDLANISSCQRNRRKGKAFKLDHYIHYDQPSNIELLNKEVTQYTSECQRNGFANSNKNTLSVQKQLVEQVPPADPILISKSNRSPSPEQLQHLPFQILNSVNTYTKNGYSLPAQERPLNHCSPQAHESPLNHCRSPPEESVDVFIKNTSTVPKENTQFANEGKSVNVSNALPESVLPKLEADVEHTSNPVKKRQEIFECEYCAMAFKDCVMYTVHMGYHGFGDPFTCNMCGQESKDRVEFFIHIARAAHV